MVLATAARGWLRLQEMRLRMAELVNEGTKMAT